MYWMEFQGKTVFKIKSLTSQLLGYFSFVKQVIGTIWSS